MKANLDEMTGMILNAGISKINNYENDTCSKWLLVSKWQIGAKQRQVCYVESLMRC